MSCLTALLGAQDASVWADEYTLKVFQLLLNYTLHPKPKVQQAHHTRRQILLSHDNQELRPRWEGTEYSFHVNRIWFLFI